LRLIGLKKLMCAAPYPSIVALTIAEKLRRDRAAQHGSDGALSTDFAGMARLEQPELAQPLVPENPFHQALSVGRHDSGGPADVGNRVVTEQSGQAKVVERVDT
jgi:hypothetical protein